LLQPAYVFLDEVDSWLDVDAFRSVAQLLRDVANEQTSFVIITHYFTILDYLPVDNVVVLQEGKIVEQWWQEIVTRVQQQGFGR
jgi:Fe-S cluster assembly ATPase SufC